MNPSISIIIPTYKCLESIIFMQVLQILQLVRDDGYITCYCALLGMNDPICLFFGNYDRFNLITNKWTYRARNPTGFWKLLKNRIG